MNQTPRKHAPHLQEPIRYRDGIDLAATPSATKVSRLFIKNTLQEWGVGSLVEDAHLIGNELLTNAIKACKSTANSQWSQGSVSKLIRLRLLGLAHSVVIEVWDRCPTLPVLQPFSLEATSGRGLYIVESMSRRWGFYPMERGKVVWADLEVPVPQRVTA